MDPLHDQRFGRLTAVEPTAKRRRNAVVWVCRCDCGRLEERSQQDLCDRGADACRVCSRAAHPKAALDLTGRRFGHLVAVERAGLNRHRQPLWRCDCDCGEGRAVEAYRLNDGRTVNCGKGCPYYQQKGVVAPPAGKPRKPTRAQVEAAEAFAATTD